MWTLTSGKVMKFKDVNNLYKIVLTVILLSGSTHLLLQYSPFWKLSGLQAPFGMFTSNLGLNQDSAVKIYDFDSKTQVPLRFSGPYFISNVLIPYKTILINVSSSDEKDRAQAFFNIKKSWCRNQKSQRKFIFTHFYSGEINEKIIDCSR